MKLWYNPNCSKSQRVKEILDTNNFEYTLINYLDTHLSIQELKLLLNKLHISNVREIMRVDEEVYIEHNLDNKHLEELVLLSSIVEHPILLQRPILELEDKAIIARPPALIYDFLNISEKNN